MKKNEQILKKMFTFVVLSALLMFLNKKVLIPKKPIDFSNEINTINWNLTKEEIITNKGKNPDNIVLTAYNDVLMFSESQFNQYLGTTNYGFNKDDTLVFIEFTFKTTEDYENYMRDFVQRHYAGDEIFKEYWIWSGNIANDKIDFSSIKQTLTIKINKI